MRLSLKTKIIVVAMVPFLMYLLITVINFNTDFAAYRRADTNVTNTDKLVKLSTAIHELQKERGKSNSFLNGGAHISDLQAQHKLTDSEIKDLDRIDITPPKLKQTLDELRREVENHLIEPAKAILAYREMIMELFSQEIAYVNMSRGTPVETKMVNILILEMAKESAGRLRANMTGVLAAETPVSDAQLDLLLASKSGVDASLACPALQLAEKTNNDVKAFSDRQDWHFVNDTFRKVIRNSKEGHYRVNSESFFNKASSSIDQMATFVQEEVKEVKTTATDRRSSSLQKAAWNAGISLSLSVLVGFGIWFVVVSTTRPISRVVDDLNQGSEQLSHSSNELKEASNKIAEASTESASSLQETSAAIEEISSMVAKNSDSAARAKDTSDSGKEQALEGKRVMEEMRSAIVVIKNTQEHVKTEIDDSNQKISNIVTLIAEIKEKTKVINEIVFQTKLLSFNASVEAARAGEHGKGFAVVAEEIGELANMSGKAAHEISSMLERSSQDVSSIIRETTVKINSLMGEATEKVKVGMSVSERLFSVFDNIVNSVNDMTTMVSEISLASKEQSGGVSQVSAAMSQLDQANQQNASASHEAAQSANALANEVVRLKSVVNALKDTIFAENNAANVHEISAAEYEESQHRAA